MRKDHLKKSVYIMMNDIIEQCFKKMIHFPEEGEKLNKIISEATKNLNELTNKLDENHHSSNSPEGKIFYDEVASELRHKSLTLQRQLQNLVPNESTKIS